tara:strand:- start:446 stop:1153 length:708 start_codon:yes stop_codon:yes gene_type:complete
MLTIKNIRDRFVEKYKVKDFEEDGNLEILGASFIADEESIFGKPNAKYQQAELHWYNSQNCNTDKLRDFYGKVPAIWENVANTRGNVNSNYGHLIYSALNGSQYENAYRELKRNPDSRRATMIYQHPDMHQRHREHGKDDFVCTNAVTYYNKVDVLHAVVQMRSNDVVFGYMNDYYWQCKVLERLAGDLEMEVGGIIWQAQSLHMYPRHMGLLLDSINEFVIKDYAEENIGAYDG